MRFTHTLSVGFNRENEIAFVRRRKPPNYGLINLPGGKIEAGESPEDAAMREFTEETGCVSDCCTLIGTMEFPDQRCVIGVFLNGVGPQSRMPEEEVTWLSPFLAVRTADLVENLKVIIPLCTVPVRHWTYREKVTAAGIEHQLAF